MTAGGWLACVFIGDCALWGNLAEDTLIICCSSSDIGMASLLPPQSLQVVNKTDSCGEPSFETLRAEIVFFVRTAFLVFEDTSLVFEHVFLFEHVCLFEPGPGFGYGSAFHYYFVGTLPLCVRTCVFFEHLLACSNTRPLRCTLWSETAWPGHGPFHLQVHILNGAVHHGGQGGQWWGLVATKVALLARCLCTHPVGRHTLAFGAGLNFMSWVLM